MTTYAYRCPDHDDFLVDQPMASTTPRHACPSCGVSSPKVLSGNFQYHGGRAQFHDGVEGTGETGRETRDRWLKEAKESGVSMEPAGVRWV